MTGAGGAGEHQQGKVLKEERRRSPDFAGVAGVTGPGGLATAGPATSVHVQQGRQLATPSAPAPTVAARTPRARCLGLRVNLLGYSLALPLVPVRKKHKIRISFEKYDWLKKKNITTFVVQRHLLTLKSGLCVITRRKGANVLQDKN